MAGTDDLGTLSIGEYLLSLADGIVHAQQQLSLSRVAAADGQAAVVYQIPRVDFELKMSLELARIEGQGGDGAPQVALGPGGVFAPVLKARPVEVGPSSGRSALSGTISTIKGSFVAVPVQGGRPPPVVTLSLQQPSPLRLSMTVGVRTTATEPVVGAEAEFNIDRELSRQLSGKAGITGGLKPEETFLEKAVAVTDQHGQASCDLIVSPAEPIGTCIAVVIDVAGRTETVIYRREQAAAAGGGA